MFRHCDGYLGSTVGAETTLRATGEIKERCVSPITSENMNFSTKQTVEVFAVEHTYIDSSIVSDSHTVQCGNRTIGSNKYVQITRCFEVVGFQ